MSGCARQFASRFGAFVSSATAGEGEACTPSNNNSAGGAPQQARSPFHHPQHPDITVGDYANRMGRFMRCSDQSFLCATAYIVRLQTPSAASLCSLPAPCVSLTRSTAHRLMLASVTVATKFVDEIAMPNSYYALVGGVHVHELNTLELEMLRSLSWNAFVSSEEYTRAMQTLLPPHPKLDQQLWWCTVLNAHPVSFLIAALATPTNHNNANHNNANHNNSNAGEAPDPRPPDHKRQSRSPPFPPALAFASAGPLGRTVPVAARAVAWGPRREAGPAAVVVPQRVRVVGRGRTVLGLHTVALAVPPPRPSPSRALP